MVNDKIKNSRRLEKICLTCPFFRRSSNAIDKIGLNAKQISKDGNDQTGLTVFYCSENNTFCFMKFLRQIISRNDAKFRKDAKRVLNAEYARLRTGPNKNHFEMNTILVDVFLDLSSLSIRTR